MHTDILTAEPVTVQNVQQENLYYIKITNTRGDKHFVNIGEKTFNKLQELTQFPEPTKTDNNAKNK